MNRRYLQNNENKISYPGHDKNFSIATREQIFVEYNDTLYMQLLQKFRINLLTYQKVTQGTTYSKKN